jgi:hypothetical protein
MISKGVKEILILVVLREDLEMKNLDVGVFRVNHIYIRRQNFAFIKEKEGIK